MKDPWILEGNRIKFLARPTQDRLTRLDSEITPKKIGI
jgi:hypothetical protein